RHIWLGLRSGGRIACRSGFCWGAPLEQLLGAVLLATLAPGVAGLVLQQLSPRMITARVEREAPYEAIPHLCHALRQKADATLKAIWTAEVPDSQKSIMASQAGIGAKVQLQAFYDQHLRALLAHPLPRAAMLADPLRAEAAF